jgi:hypothetical protein
MKILLPVIVMMILAGCRAAPSPVSLEETARKIHRDDFGLYFRDLSNGETLEINAESRFRDLQGARIELVFRALVNGKEGQSSEEILRTLERAFKGEEAVGGTAGTSSPRECARRVDELFRTDTPPPIRDFLRNHSAALGRYSTPAGKPYALYCLSDGADTVAPEKAIHAYVRSAP